MASQSTEDILVTILFTVIFLIPSTCLISLLPYVSSAPGMMALRAVLLEYLIPDQFVSIMRWILGESLCCHRPRIPTYFNVSVKSKNELNLKWKARYHPIHEYMHTEEYVVETLNKFYEWEQAALAQSTRCTIGGFKPGEEFTVRVYARNKVGWSEYSEIKKGRTFSHKNSIDGADHKRFSWGQSQTDVSLIVPLKENTKSKDIKIDVHPTTLKISIKGDEVVSGELYRNVQPDNSLWHIEDGEETNYNNETTPIRYLQLTMPKIDEGLRWPRLIVGGKTIDVDEIPFTSKWLGTHTGDLGVKRVC